MTEGWLLFCVGISCYIVAQGHFLASCVRLYRRLDLTEKEQFVDETIDALLSNGWTSVGVGLVITVLMLTLGFAFNLCLWFSEGEMLSMSTEPDDV